jgi:hypothetical protein
MDTPRPYRRIALFVLLLVTVFAAAAAIGSLVEPAETEGGMDAHVAESHGTHSETEEPAGLAISAHGRTLRLDGARFQRGEPGQLRFAIEGADGRPVTGFEELHERRLHLILVRRDGTGFRHLRPEMDADGTWATPVRFAESGVYRAFADFSVDGEQETLAADVFVSGGAFEAAPLPPPSPLAATEGYEVRLDAGKPIAGERSELRFAVSRGGAEVDDLVPYLGAQGHLVALREGDLAFLHVHPEEGHENAPGEIAFEATFPTAGRYRLYLQFRHGGAVHTAELTLAVGR